MSGIRVYRLLSLASSLSALRLLFIDAITCVSGLLRLLISQFVCFALIFFFRQGFFVFLWLS